MKKLNRIAGVIAASAMVMSMLSACGGNSAENQSSSQSAGDASAATSGAAGQSSEGKAVFKIGSIGPLTGSGAAYGKAVVNGTKLAIKEINAAGGINGYQVEEKDEDDELNNEKSVNAYNTLMDWGMQFLVGPTTSGCTIAVAAEAEKDHIFLLTPSGTAEDCIKADNAFRVCFSDPAQGAESAKYIAQNKLGSKIGVIYDSSDTYSSGVYKAFADEAKKDGLNIVSAEAFTADSKTDFSSQIGKAKDAGADLLFLPIYYQEASLILQQCKDASYAPKFFGCDGMDGILTVENFDQSLANGLMLMTPYSPDASDEVSQKFTKAYEAEFGETPNQFGADAYDGVYAIKAACEAAKATPEMSYQELCDLMMKEFPQITVSGVTSEKLTWQSDGEPSKSPRVFKVEDGKYVSMEK